MKKTIHLLFLVGFGWIGWMVGARVGIMTAYFFSGFGSLLGFYLGWKIVNRWLE